MEDIERVKKILFEESLSCVILKDSQIYKSNQRGVAPVIDLIDKKIDISNAFVADKVIGKAAAMLFIYCKVKEIYTPVISEPAINILRSSGIIVHYEKCVPYIINRSNTGQCPMEKAVKDISSPVQALISIKEKIKELSNQNSQKSRQAN